MHAVASSGAPWRAPAIAEQADRPVHQGEEERGRGHVEGRLHGCREAGGPRRQGPREEESGRWHAAAILGIGRPPRHPAEAEPAPSGRACIPRRSEEHTSALQSLMRISYAFFCLKKKK